LTLISDGGILFTLKILLLTLQSITMEIMVAKCKAKGGRRTYGLTPTVHRVVDKQKTKEKNKRQQTTMTNNGN
jgi:hypothetical protein